LRDLEDDKSSGIQIVYPDPNAIFYLSSDLPPEAQRILLQVVVDSSLVEVTILLNGRPLAQFDGTAGPLLTTWWQLEAGEHELALRGVTVGGQIEESQPRQFTVLPHQIVTP
jgi:hypothetical protein